jgi:hypothetical protein
MVLMGKTLSPVGHRRAAGERATPHALRVVTAQLLRAPPAERTGGLGQQCRDHGPQCGPALCARGFQILFSFIFPQIRIDFKNA